MKIEKIDNKFYVNCPFSLKENLKRAIPSAKWDGKKNSWYVGPRSGNKLEAWVAENTEALNVIADKQQKFEEKLSAMIKLNGHTFDIKDELKEKFGAIFSKKTVGPNVSSGWYVDADKVTEAQAYVDTHNEKRRRNIITEEDVTGCKTVSETLKLIEKAINNFDPETSLYKYHDDCFCNSLFASYEKDDEVFNKKVLNNIYQIGKDVNEYITFADENDNPGIFFDSSLSDTLRVLRIPDLMIIDFYQDTFIDYRDIEESLIREKIRKNQYRTDYNDLASKDLDNAKNSPIYKIVSEKTGAEYDVTDLVDIECVQSSSRVHIYKARNIPVLFDENYKTKVYYWRNKPKSKVISLEDLEE